jgi:uncharacterized repeat protein (TIGR03803 family)
MADSKQHEGWISRISLRASCALVLPVMLGLAIVTSQSVQAQTLSVLYAFAGGSDGARPFAGLIRNSAGDFYGTTANGGSSCWCGTVFKLDARGTETVLYAFAGGTDGDTPYSNLLLDAKGDLYGTTVSGGTSGYGTVFKVSATGAETVLHNFTGLDGENPYEGLIRDAAGNLYSTTSNGGTSGYGTVFKLSKTGKVKVLHSFAGYPTDGEFSYAGLVQDVAGNLYGTTYRGGTSDYGTVFKVRRTGKENVLHSFTGADGSFPYARLLMDAAGNLYGTTSSGGTSGFGTVFEVSRTGKEKVLYSFAGGTDGGGPYRGLVMDAAGNLYGTTGGGGTFGFGTVFVVYKTGKQKVLYSFSGEQTEEIPMQVCFWAQRVTSMARRPGEAIPATE